MVCSLLVGLNIQAGFQKLYSMPKLKKSINLVVLVVLLVSTLLFTFSFWMFYRAGLYNHIFGESVVAPNIIVAYIYILSYSFFFVVTPLLNANRKTISYGLSTAAPVFITISGVLALRIQDLNWLLALVSISNLSVILLNLALNMRVLSAKNYSARHFRKIFAYAFGYTWLSLPTLGSRFVTDLAARSLLLSSAGDVAVAALTFSTSLFAIFRSIEQEFFRAVTPFFMKNSASEKQQLALTRKLITYQSILTVFIFACSPLWIEILIEIFPEKPDEVFSPFVLIMMALITVISYHKNFYLSRAKKNVNRLKAFFKISISINLCILVAIYIIELSVENLLLIQGFFFAINLMLVRNITREQRFT